MVDGKLLFFVVLCLTPKLWLVNSLDLKAMLNNVTVNNLKENDLFYKTVQISDSEIMKIYLYSPEYTQDFTIEEVYNATYIGLNCKYAELIMVSLHEYVSHFPKLYNYLFTDGFIDKNKVKAFPYKSFMNDFLKDIDIFINIMNTFLSKKPQFLFHSDKSALIALISLKFNIYEISKYYAIIKDDIIITMILEVMIEIQGFLITNCDDTPPNIQDSYFHGFSIVNDHKQKSIVHFLNHIEIYKSRQEPETCSKEQMIAKETRAAIFKLPMIDPKKPLIHEYSLDITLSSALEFTDPKTIFRYQKSFINTLVIAIYKTFDSMKKNKNISADDKSSLVNIIQAITADVNLPIDLNFCLTELSAILQKESMDDDFNLTIHYDLLMKNEKTEVRDFKVNLDSAMDTLKSILTILKDKKDELQCFSRYFNLLYSEYDKYRPLPNSKPLTKKWDEEYCSFIQNMYKICYAITILMNKSLMVTLEKERKLFTDEVIIHLKNVKQYLIILINKKKLEDIVYMKPELRRLYRTANNMIFIIQNLKINEIMVKGLKRLAQKFMNELNIYGIQFCKANYLLFKSISFREYGNIKATTADVNMILTKNPEGDRENDDINYDKYDLKYLCENYIEKSKVFQIYESVISVYLEGKLIKINTFCDDKKFFTFNYDTLHAFYHIFYTYYIAAYFHEIKKLALVEGDKNLPTVYVMETKFHPYYTHLLINATSELAKIISGEKEKKDTTSLEKYIQSHLGRLGFILGENNEPYNITHLQTILDEISLYRETIYGYYYSYNP